MSNLQKSNSSEIQFEVGVVLYPTANADALARYIATFANSELGRDASLSQTATADRRIVLAVHWQLEDRTTNRLTHEQAIKQ